MIGKRDGPKAATSGLSGTFCVSQFATARFRLGCEVVSARAWQQTGLLSPEPAIPLPAPDLTFPSTYLCKHALLTARQVTESCACSS